MIVTTEPVGHDGPVPQAEHRPSVLFHATAAETEPTIVQEAPECFPDLNLDQVVDGITAGYEEYELQPYFFTPLDDVQGVTSRQEVFRDLDDTPTLEQIRAFTHTMRHVRKQLAWSTQLRYRYQKARWFLDAATLYSSGVTTLAEVLEQCQVRSDALLAIREYTIELVRSRAFTALVADTARVHDALDAIIYCTNILGPRVEVSKYEGQADYSTDVLRTFEKFKQGAVETPRFDLRDSSEMNHVEERIHDLVVQLFPEAFASLDQFCDIHRDFIDPVVARFDREVQFYASYLNYIEPLKQARLPFCSPRVSGDDKAESVTSAFDLALASRLVAEHSPVVCNDFQLSGPERIIVVTGPNQGGKTTFARMFGQLHHLASLGCPVPGSEGTLLLPDQILTHFEREEDPTSLVGKLEDDLIRVHAILSEATPDSVMILNEIFNSTTLHDAQFLGSELLGEIARRDLLCVCVTFVDELASLNHKTVSMVSTVGPSRAAVRTYKVLRRPADGLAYASALAEQYGLTFRQLKDRITR